jgi:hypothetical protein
MRTKRSSKPAFPATSLSAVATLSLPVLPLDAQSNTIVQLFLFHESGVIAGDRKGIDIGLRRNS